MPQQMPPAPDYLAGFRAERERSEQELNKRAAYAAQIAEMLGQYTPELQSEVMAPLGKYPTMGEYPLSSPVRGLGKLFGNKGMQEFGSPQPFQLSPVPQSPPVMTQLPSGVPEDMRQFLESMAESQGFVKQPPKSVIPNLPSEYSSTSPMLKTKTQR